MSEYIKRGLNLKKLIMLWFPYLGLAVLFAASLFQAGVFIDILLTGSIKWLIFDLKLQLIFAVWSYLVLFGFSYLLGLIIFRPCYKVLPVESKGAFLKTICTTIIHILGIWFVGLSVNILMPMSVKGYIWAHEPNTLILLREISMIIFGVVYLLYNFRMFVKLHRTFINYVADETLTSPPFSIKIIPLIWI